MDFALTPRQVEQPVPAAARPFGYRTELPIEQRLRDVLGPQMGGRTAQVMKLIIFRQKVSRGLAP